MLFRITTRCACNGRKFHQLLLIAARGVATRSRLHAHELLAAAAEVKAKAAPRIGSHCIGDATPRNGRALEHGDASDEGVTLIG